MCDMNLIVWPSSTHVDHYIVFFQLGSKAIDGTNDSLRRIDHKGRITLKVAATLVKLAIPPPMISTFPSSWKSICTLSASKERK